MAKLLMGNFGDVDHTAGDEARTFDEYGVAEKLERMEEDVEYERADRAKNLERLARIQANYEAWANRPKEEPTEKKKEEPKTGNGAGSDEWWQASALMDEGSAAVAERRFADAVPLFRKGLAVPQDDSALKEKLREGMSWAKMRLGAERKKKNAPSLVQ